MQDSYIICCLNLLAFSATWDPKPAPGESMYFLTSCFLGTEIMEFFFWKYAGLNAKLLHFCYPELLCLPAPPLFHSVSTVLCPSPQRDRVSSVWSAGRHVPAVSTSCKCATATWNTLLWATLLKCLLTVADFHKTAETLDF